MPTSDGDDEWTWAFDAPGRSDFEALDRHIQNRIVETLDEIVADEWREPTEHIDPLAGAPWGKLRVGNYRLAVVIDHDDRTLTVRGIEHRRNAYKGDD
jgi:Cytotoxic translational repressor of toxin-antitoxin stability system